MLRTRLSYVVAAVLLVLPLPLAAAAQQADTKVWQGEWGAYTALPRPAGSYQRYAGQSLRVLNCSGSGCEAELSVSAAGGGSCNGKGNLHAVSDGEATILVVPLGRDKEHQCTVRLKRSGEAGARSITATAESAECGSYYCTSGVSFDGSYPFRSASTFHGEELTECYLARSAARMAICGSEALAAQEKALVSLSYEVHDLLGSRAPLNETLDAVLRACDASADAAACLPGEMARASAELEKQKAERMARLTEAGDPAAAAKAISAIRGRYRHSFANGDVQGDSFQSHDTLSIQPASATSIRFKAHTEFFNGHECNASGVAEFRRSGAFVWSDQTEAPGCYLEIIPTAKGVRFNDPTGNCRMATCGARGGWGGAEFKFTERIHTEPAAAKQR